MRQTEVMAHRIHAQQLDSAPQSQDLSAAAIVDIGVQDTGRDGASWALANRGVRIAGPKDLIAAEDLVLVWTLRGAPHYYRRAEILEVLAAVSPMSEADAAKRIFDASKPLKDRGIAVLDGLTEVAAQMRRLVDRPMVKGDVSGGLAGRVDEVHLRWCVPCQATHVWEQPFRLSALYAGLELEPGTSPPVLRRIPGWPRRHAGPADPTTAPEHLQPIRNYLRFLGPATPQEAAWFVDAPVAEIKKHWPEDAVEVDRDGTKAWLLGEPVTEVDPSLVRLLGGFDLLLQGRDRLTTVPDKSRHKALWPTIGRPGAVLAGTEIVGTWRPKAAGRKFTLRFDPWTSVGRAVRAGIEEQAERLAAHRESTLTGVVTE